MCGPRKRRNCSWSTTTTCHRNIVVKIIDGAKERAWTACGSWCREKLSLRECVAMIGHIYIAPGDITH